MVTILIFASIAVPIVPWFPLEILYTTSTSFSSEMLPANRLGYLYSRKLCVWRNVKKWGTQTGY